VSLRTIRTNSRGPGLVTRSCVLKEECQTACCNVDYTGVHIRSTGFFLAQCHLLLIVPRATRVRFGRLSMQKMDVAWRCVCFCSLCVLKFCRCFFLLQPRLFHILHPCFHARRVSSQRRESRGFHCFPPVRLR